MDRVQGEGPVSRKAGRGAFSPGLSLLIAAAVVLISGAGCLWGRAAKGPPPLPPGEEEEYYTRIDEEEPPPGSYSTEPTETAQAPASSGATGGPESTEMEAAGAPAGVESAVPEPPRGEAGTVSAPMVAPPEASAEEAPPGVSGGEQAQEVSRIPGESPPTALPRRAPPAGGKHLTHIPTEVPAWAMGKEVLVYRVEFLGMTMGYARFTFKGKVSMRGREAYHLNVRAWTSDFLSVIYPINDTIDYYLDVKTLAPLQQEFAHPEKAKDDVAIYDQENGKIVYRYKNTGEIRKQVDVPPDTYDPVSVAYYFRTRDLGAEDRPRSVYGGRKVWEISSKLLGKERIEVSGKPVDTVVIQPVIKREGQLTDKGDLRMWLTNDARHVPVRIYAKFKKIKIWTLNAELMPPREGG